MKTLHPKLNTLLRSCSTYALITIVIGIGGILMSSGKADAHVAYTGTTMTNGNGTFLDRETLRKDLALTVTGHAAQNAPSSGIGVASGLPADNGAFSSYSNVNGVVSSRLDTTIQSNSGWINGLNHGADSHFVKFFGFQLNTASSVSIFSEALSGIGTSSNALIPSISLYSGKAPFQAHDDAPIPLDYNGDGQPDPFDPSRTDGTPLYTFAPGQEGMYFATQASTLWNEPVDRFSVAGLQADFTAGNLSVDRNGDGIITQADVTLMAPEIETLSYLGHTLNTSNSSVEWEGTLGPGFYTFLVGGSDASSVNLDNHGLRVNFTAAPVPLPAAVWLFGSGMAGLAAWARRRMTTSRP